MEKLPIAATAAVALILPAILPMPANSIGLLLPAVQKAAEPPTRTAGDPGTYGFAFAVLEPVRVDALGIAAGAHPPGGTVSLWDNEFRLIATVDVPASGLIRGFSFDWERIPSIVLKPGTYVIGASYVPGGQIPFDAGAGTIAQIRWIEGRQGIGEGALPRERTDAFGPLGVLWANFATVVPEPASWAMLIAGFGIVGLALRRRRSRATVTLA